MARKQDARHTAPKPAAKTKAKGAKGAKTAARAGKAKSGSGLRARADRGSQTALEAVRIPVMEASSKAKSTAKKALKSAKVRARELVPDVHAPSLGGVPSQVGEALKTVGTQIAHALNTDVGRVMVAELLMYAAKSLTKAAANTEAAGDAKSALLNAGAKVGAAAADAGAKMVETGQSAAETGSKLLGEGKAAAEAGVEAAGDAASSAGDLMREVAQAAVGAVGGAVVDAAQRVVGKRGRKPIATSGKRDGGGGARKTGHADTAPTPAANAGRQPPNL